MWSSRTKSDLIIEVWEKLDCESVGAAEIEAIETAVEARFGAGAVDSPMVLARMLADEGAELRHSEILELFVRRRQPERDVAMTDFLFDLESVARAIGTARRIETERRMLKAERDTAGLKRLRDRVLASKNRCVDGSLNPRVPQPRRAEFAEIAEWLTIWLQTPEIFENWLSLRIASQDFRDRFDGPTQE